MALVSPAPSLRKEATLSILRSKHHCEDSIETREDREKIVEMARKLRQLGKPRVAELDRHFDQNTYLPQSEPGSSGLRRRHLQAAMSTTLVDDILVSAFGKTVFSSELRPEFPRPCMPVQHERRKA